MSARGKARKRALDLIFAAEARQTSARLLLDELRATGEVQVNDYTTTLVEGVEEHRSGIDEVIGAHAQGWTLDRMPAVDRNILRLAVYELRHRPEVPEGVVISEAVRLATELSTDDSPTFVNGVLGAVARSIVAGPEV